METVFYVRLKSLGERFARQWLTLGTKRESWCCYANAFNFCSIIQTKAPSSV